MHADDLIIDQPNAWELLEHITKDPPKFNIIPSLAFIKEPIDSVHGLAFMVSSEQEEVIGIFDFISKQ